MMEQSLRIEQLQNKNHDRNQFRCGNSDLDE